MTILHSDFCLTDPMGRISVSGVQEIPIFRINVVDPDKPYCLKHSYTFPDSDNIIIRCSQFQDFYRTYIICIFMHKI